MSQFGGGTGDTFYDIGGTGTTIVPGFRQTALGNADRLADLTARMPGFALATQVVQIQQPQLAVLAALQRQVLD